MSTFLTSNRHGYSVKFSPFDANRFCVASSLLYGFAGGGTLYLLELNEEGAIKEVRQLQWCDGLFDVTWSEQDENIVVTASGDGTLQLWNIDQPEDCFTPLLCFREHKSEVCSVDWNQSRFERQLLSASWDCTIKLWDPTRTSSLVTYFDHSELVYNAMFSPHIANVFSSVSADGTLKLWNTLDYRSNSFKSIKAHDGEVLTCDWSKFNPNIIATGASDGFIRGWDVRNIEIPLFELYGFEYAVRRIKFSPFSASVLVSAGYDFTTRVWDFERKSEAIEIINLHSEVVCGIDWNQNRVNQIANCGWDSFVHVHTPPSLRNL